MRSDGGFECRTAKGPERFETKPFGAQEEQLVVDEMKEKEAAVAVVREVVGCCAAGRSTSREKVPGFLQQLVPCRRRGLKRRQ